MKKIVLTLFLILCVSYSGSAQIKLPEKCQIFYPDVLLSNAVLFEEHVAALEKSPDYGQGKAPRNRTFWIVYSDRNDNVTYDAPGSTTKYSSLSLNDRLRIAQIKNGYALVYTEPQEDIAYPMISQYAECKGWVSMKNLLLWHSCPANDAGIYNKALLCVNLDQVSKDGDVGKMFYNPRDKSKYKTLMTDMNFYFVMKREGNLSLLADAHTLDGRSDRVLLGWVPEQSYVAWNQRSCIEPTWEKKDVEYFSAENQQIRIYEDKGLNNCVTMIPFKSKQSTEKDPHLYRMHPDDLRLPLLDGGTDDMYRCSTFGAVGGGTLVVGGEEDKVSPLGLSEAELRQMSNINIGIVIDGTSSMEPFYPAVKEAIKEGVKFFGNKYNVKVGVVIYRDYSDKEFVTEIMPLTNPGNPKLDSFLDTGGKYGIRSNTGDRTLEEAMYEGINVALDRMGFNSDQSNLLLVVGDCGNDRADTKYSPDALIKKIVDKNVNLMGFQVRRGAEDAFALFNNQLQRLLFKSLEKKYDNLSKGTVKVQIKSTDDGFALENDAKSNLFIGSHNMPMSGAQQMPLNKLSSLMQQSIMYCAESVKFQIDLITSASKTVFEPNPNLEKGSIDINEEFIKARIGVEAYEELMKSNQLVTYMGYSHKAHKSGRPYFKPVVFISSDELNTLIERLAPVNAAAVVQNNDRAPYVNAMKALIQSMVPDITDDRMNQMGYSEVMATVAGLNEAAGALKGYTIVEIANPQAVSNVEYLSLVDDFKRKFRILQRLKSNPYKYTRVFNGLKYYWLPVEDLP